ncbi:acyltransferase [Gelidibacter japonicus]|uniref:acyltransferase n=1 Tax=Gelidibacter japonicus TaxID=1962232 RepID=UPI003A919C2E
MIAKFWSKKHPFGLVKAFIIMFHSIFFKLRDKISTLLWKYNFKKFGKKSRVLSNTTIRFPGNIQLGSQSIIGRGVSLSSEISNATLIIGDNTQLNRNVRIDFTGNVKIGSNVVISSDTQIYSHSHGYDPKSKPVGKPIIVEDNVWIGSGCYIMDSVEYIGKGAIVATGAIVTKNVEQNTIVGGNPAKIIKSIKREK